MARGTKEGDAVNLLTGVSIVLACAAALVLLFEWPDTTGIVAELDEVRADLLADARNNDRRYAEMSRRLANLERAGGLFGTVYMPDDDSYSDDPESGDDHEWN
jgi:hypothetical protein